MGASTAEPQARRGVPVRVECTPAAQSQILDRKPCGMVAIFFNALGGSQIPAL